MKFLASCALAVGMTITSTALALPAQAATYNATVRSNITTTVDDWGTHYSAKFTVSNTSRTAKEAHIESPTIPGLQCSMTVPARSQATCVAEATTSNAAPVSLTVQPAADSELTFAPVRRTIKRAPKPRPSSFPAHCNPEIDEGPYYDCGDPAAASIMMGWDAYAEQTGIPAKAGVPHTVNIYIYDEDWIRGFVADISSPRFATNSGRQVGPEYGAKPGEKLLVRHYMGSAYDYEVTVVPTEKEVAQGYMDLPVTLTSANGTVYSDIIDHVYFT